MLTFSQTLTFMPSKDKKQPIVSTTLKIIYISFCSIQRPMTAPKTAGAKSYY